MNYKFFYFVGVPRFASRILFAAAGLTENDIIKPFWQLFFIFYISPSKQVWLSETYKIKKGRLSDLYNLYFVGVPRFELGTSCSQSRRTNRAVLHPEAFSFRNCDCKVTAFLRICKQFCEKLIGIFKNSGKMNKNGLWIVCKWGVRVVKQH